MLARKGGCAPLGHLPRLWVNTPPGRPCSRCQAPKRDGTELWVFLGCPVPGWQHHPAQGQGRCRSPRVPLGQVGTRGTFQPSLPSLLSTFPFQRREEVENAQLSPGRAVLGLRAQPGTPPPALSPSGLPDQLSGAGSPPTSPVSDPLWCSLSLYPPGRTGVKQPAPLNPHLAGL